MILLNNSYKQQGNIDASTSSSACYTRYALSSLRHQLPYIHSTRLAAEIVNLWMIGSKIKESF